ncbi:MAG: TadE family protein [Dehalococcoidia bacterium]
MNRRRLRREDGQAMVEFVLVFPLLLVMVLMLVEFGFALNAYISVNNASSEAARYAAVGSAPNGVGPCDSGAVSPSIEGLAVRASNNTVTCSEVTVRYLKRMPGSQYVRGDAVSIRVERDYTMVTPLSGLASAFSFGTIPSTFSISACAEARLERGPTDQSGLLTGGGCT